MIEVLYCIDYVYIILPAITNQCPHAYFTRSVTEVVKTLASGVAAGKCSMVIRRGHVLEDALKQARKAFLTHQ